MKVDRLLLGALLLGAAAQAEEEPLVRSSHPRGFVEGGALPPIIRSTAPQGSGKAGGVSAAQDRGPASGAAASQAGAGGVNITGNTRIDARAQGATATAVGQQNASGNRVGAIGGK